MDFKRYLAEFLGTFFLIFIGCGSAIFSSSMLSSEVSMLGVACAFGFTFIALYYLVGIISGCHLNPAVSTALAISGHLHIKHLGFYVLAQILGAILGAAVVYLIATGNIHFGHSNQFFANGYGVHSPGNYSVLAVFLVEMLGTMLLVLIYIGSYNKLTPLGFGGITIGLGLMAIYFLSFPISNAGMNPARSIATAIFAPQWALEELWLFVIAPLAGGVIGAGTGRYLA